MRKDRAAGSQDRVVLDDNVSRMIPVDVSVARYVRVGTYGQMARQIGPPSEKREQTPEQSPDDAHTSPRSLRRLNKSIRLARANEKGVDQRGPLKRIRLPPADTPYAHGYDDARCAAPISKETAE